MPQIDITDREKVLIDTLRDLDDNEKHFLLITLRGRDTFKIKKLFSEIDVGYIIKQEIATA